MIARIPALRLLNQRLIQQETTDVQSIVKLMGAVQAQDYPMAKWAAGLRVPGATDAAVEAALDAGLLVRTHVLRPTWHMVSGSDVRWMLALSAANIKAASRSHDRELEIDAALYIKTNDLITKALEGGKNLTREELMQVLEKAGVPADSSRAVHFMCHAEVDGIVCNGVMRGKKLTYALLEEKVAPAPVPARDEALAALALRYFSSHGPATLADFQWWSGLSVADAREGLGSIKAKLETLEEDGKSHFFIERNTSFDLLDPSVLFLPAFDEYTVSYKDRSAVFDPAWYGQAITSNGIFKPVIVVNGQVKGIWKRTIIKNTIRIEPAFFTSADRLSIEVMEKATQRLGLFLGLKVELKMGK